MNMITKAPLKEGDYLLDNSNCVYRVEFVNDRLDGLRISIVKQFVTYHYATTVSTVDQLRGFRYLGDNPKLAQLLYGTKS